MIHLTPDKDYKERPKTRQGQRHCKAQRKEHESQEEDPH